MEPAVYGVQNLDVVLYKCEYWEPRVLLYDRFRMTLHLQWKLLSVDSHLVSNLIAITLTIYSIFYVVWNHLIDIHGYHLLYSDSTYLHITSFLGYRLGNNAPCRSATLIRRKYRFFEKELSDSHLFYLCSKVYDIPLNFPRNWLWKYWPQLPLFTKSVTKQRPSLCFANYLKTNNSALDYSLKDHQVHR